MDKRLGGPQSRSGRGGKDRNSQPLPGIKPRSSSQQLFRWTELLISHKKVLKRWRADDDDDDDDDGIYLKSRSLKYR